MADREPCCLSWWNNEGASAGSVNSKATLGLLLFEGRVTSACDRFADERPLIPADFLGGNQFSVAFRF
jgi:hypothetical protein